MSKNVIIAGPGGLGKHVLDALLASTQFNVTVFSRSQKPALEDKGAAVKVVDYNNVSSLRAVIRSTKADMLLSFIVELKNPDAMARSHRNLLEAAIVEGVRRFVPAEYANDVGRFPVPPSSEADKQHFREHVRRVYFFLPRGKKKYLADLPPEYRNILPVDVEAEPPRVVILGDPEDRISMTLADDIARDAAETLGRILGSKVERRYISLEALRQEVRAAHESGDLMRIECAELHEAFGSGSEVLPANTRCFEGIETTKFAQAMQEYYGKGSGCL
ncbi:hypothetical protein GGR58DRAFT_516530 [Xylaria digitata]|nr:hypothetical protein GGR58DRAFT_516530 [Xylaria digitata]